MRKFRTMNIDVLEFKLLSAACAVFLVIAWLLVIGNYAHAEVKEESRFVVEAQFESDEDIKETIIVDTKTGVAYLYVTERGRLGSGLTPLLDANGKPVIWGFENDTDLAKEEPAEEVESSDSDLPDEEVDVEDELNIPDLYEDREAEDDYMPDAEDETTVFGYTQKEMMDELEEFAERVFGMITDEEAANSDGETDENENSVLGMTKNELQVALTRFTDNVFATVEAEKMP